MGHIRCDRCGGNLITTEDEKWRFEVCILCGRERNAAVKPKRKIKKQRAA